MTLAACGSASRGRDYSPGQVTAAFASQGISLHRNRNISGHGVYWLSTRDQGPDDDPAVMAVVLTRPSAGQFTFQQSKGYHARLKRLGDVRVVWTKRALDTRVEAALGKLGHESAPAQPKPPAPPSHAQAASFAQTLAKIPQPLRAAVRRTAAAPSAHVTMTGNEISGSGDYSTVQQVGELRTKVFCVEGDEVIDGTTMYTRGSLPPQVSRRSSKKWAKQDSKDLPAAARSDWPRAQLLTFAPPLAMLAQAGRVSNLGRQTIDGVATTHYRTRMDFPGFPSSGGQFGNMGVIDVWVDKRDGYIRRARLDLGTTETVTLSRFGEPVHVTVPPADQTIDVGKTRGHAKAKLFVSSTTAGLGGCARQ